MSVWDAMRYGFSPVYWITIAGVPVVFIERATGLSLPSGYTTEDASLVIDSTAPIGVESVNRETGVPVSMPLGFKLLDTLTVRDWLRRWIKSMTITADMTATQATAAVDDSTGWSNGDAVYMGLERATIGTVASGTSLTGLTRATVGTLAYAHATSTTAQIMTDRPRFWRGREVVLWASPVDPSGFPTGTALADDAVQVWRGDIDTGPDREVDGFRFAALSIDRKLDRELAPGVSGQVVDTSAKVSISSGYKIACAIRANDNAGGYVWQYDLELYPFAADADGDLLTHGEIRDRVIAAWSAAVSAEGGGANVGSMEWGSTSGENNVARVTIPANANVYGFEIFIAFDGVQLISTTSSWPQNWSAATATLGGRIELGWEAPGNALTPNQPGGLPYAWMMTVKIDDGDPSTITAPGIVALTIDGQRRAIRYALASAASDSVYLAVLSPADGAAALPTREQMVKADAQILLGDEGTLPEMMLRCLMSSGTGERSATYDTLERGQGYGIDEALVDAASFTGAPAPIGSLVGEVSSAGASFAGLFGGALGLFRHAVVARPNAAGAVTLRLVSTAPFGAGHVYTITDTDLLSATDDPVSSVRRAESPTSIAVVRPLGGGADDGDRFVFVDAEQIDARGLVEVELTVPAVDRAALWDAAGPAATSQLAGDQTAQTVEARVPPWVLGDVGDIVQLEITHPALWTWSTAPAGPGYAGAARVVGRRLDLVTGAVTLTLLADSGVSVAGLSPSMLIAAHGGTAAAPTTIDVPLLYLEHMTTALTEAVGNVWLSHYQPGQIETVTQLHEISAAAESGGLCRLTVASTSGGHSLSTALLSSLTLPTLDGGNLSTWQANFAHVDDGTTWG